MKTTFSFILLFYGTVAAGQARFIDSLRQKQHIPGISVCVGNKEGILWAQGFGYADLENLVPVTPDTKFRLGSVSKLLTSLAVGLLYQQGKLALDSPVQHYLPQFPEKQYPITSRQLAGHTAGIRHYRKKDPLATPIRYRSVTEGLTIFKDDSLLFKPGSSYNYSTYGFCLLSAVIESAAGKDFLSYMRDSIFTPWGLKGTIADYSDSIIPGRVRFYERQKGKWVNAALVDNSYKWAGGGFLSTPTDLVNMARGLLNHNILQKETVELLFTPQYLANGNNTHVGIAWRVDEDKQGRRMLHHGGLIDGGRAFVLVYPDNGIVVAITANMSGVNINLDEAGIIAGYFLKQ